MKKKLSIMVVATTLFALVVLLAGCVDVPPYPTPIIVPTLEKSMTKEQFFASFGSDNSWLGIKPNDTTLQNAREIIEAKFDRSRIKWPDSYLNLYKWDINMNLSGDISEKEGIVNEMRFYGYVEPLMLSDFIDSFGNPDSFAIIESSHGDCASYIDVIVFYHKKGIVLTHQDCGTVEKFKLDRNLPLEMRLYSIESVDKEVSERYTFVLGDNPDITKILVPIKEDLIIK